MQTANVDHILAAGAAYSHGSKTTFLTIDGRGGTQGGPGNYVTSYNKFQPVMTSLSSPKTT